MRNDKYPFLIEVPDLMLNAVCVVDKAGHFVYVNAAFERVFGYTPAEVIGTSMLALVFDDDRSRTLQAVDEILSGEKKFDFENRWIRKDGRIVHILWSARWSEAYQVRIAVAHDITDRKQLALRLEHMAQHDALTGLPNRTLFLDRLQTAMRRAHRDDTGLALLFIDLDLFKNVNDQHGHIVGDALLIEMARRLLASIRESDTAGRMGGDEFLVLLNTVHAAEHAQQIAEKIRATLMRPYLINSLSLCISPSIGVALFPEHGSEGQLLIQRSDEAMYTAKKSGGNCVQLFPVAIQ